MEEGPRHPLGEIKNAKPITCTFTLDDEDLKAVTDELGPGVIKGRSYSRSMPYEGNNTVTLQVDEAVALENLYADEEVPLHCAASSERGAWPTPSSKRAAWPRRRTLTTPRRTLTSSPGRRASDWATARVPGSGPQAFCVAASRSSSTSATTRTFPAGSP